MAERGRGAIVNIGSITGLRGTAGSAIYNANKAAMHSLTRPGPTSTARPGCGSTPSRPGRSPPSGPAEFADHVAPVLARIPSRRMSTPEEVAAAVVFLASDDAANIHGAMLSVDGGWAAT